MSTETCDSINKSAGGFDINRHRQHTQIQKRIKYKKCSI